MNLSTNLRQLMRIYGLPSLNELSRLAKIPQPTLHHIISGVTKRPRAKVLESLADFFSVSVSELSGEEPLPHVIPEEIKKSLKIRSVPIIEWENVLEWLESDDKKRYSELLLERQITAKSFALMMGEAGSSTQFPKGSLLIFDIGKPRADRVHALVYFKSTDTLIFNRLFYDEGEIYIKKEAQHGNSELIQLNIDGGDKIIAVLTEARIRY